MSYKIAQEKIREAKEHGYELLDLSNLGLEEIPSEICELQQLKYLHLQNNRISNIDCLKPLTELKQLVVEGNQLKEVPLFLFDLDIPIVLHEYQWLFDDLCASLLVYDNRKRISQLLGPGVRWQPVRMVSHAIVQILVLAHTRALISLGDHALSRAIKSALDNALDLHMNRSFDLDDVLGLDKVHYIDNALDSARNLACTLARDLDSALDIARDHDLDLDHNLDFAMAIDFDPTIDFDLTTALETISNQVLDIGYDLGLNLDPEFGRVRDFEGHIKLQKDLYPYLRALFGYSALYLTNNNVPTPPPEIYLKGNRSLKAYLLEKSDLEILNEVKVILVGEGAAGKTSLVKQLMSKGFDQKEPQTHGIKILKHQLQYNSQNFSVNFWDFGGQEIMHATHQFFLTKRCLYLLVLDSRKDERAEYWLKYVQSFGGNAPVVVVMNKTDENPSFELNRHFLSQKYPNIIAYFKTSCPRSVGITKLKEYLLKTLWNLDLRKMELAQAWINVKQKLEDTKEHYMSYKDYQTICVRHKVNEANAQKVLLELLNDLGVMLSYEKLKYYDTQVLNPLWLTSAVYRIINSSILAERKGRFHLDDLEGIINDPRYLETQSASGQGSMHFPSEKFLFIVNMMKQFELLYTIDEQYYLVPELLKKEEDLIDFDSESTVLWFQMRYEDFLPTSIIPRLMVKMHQYVYQDKVWRTGMALEEKMFFKSKANVVLDSEKRTLHVKLQGPRSRDFLSMIRETVKEINASYKDIVVSECIPLPEKYRGETFLVDYQELLGYEAADRTEYFSGKLRKAFSVDNLLNSIEKPEQRQYFKALKIFISYSHKDTDYEEKLKTHLMPLVRLNKATLWDDTCIDAGTEWNEEIFKQLEAADIVLCLISSDFIASEFCFAKELEAAMEAHKKGKKTVIPIMSREANWAGLEIAKLQGLPGKWIQDLNDDKAWTEVSKGIEKVINKEMEKRRSL